MKKKIVIASVLKPVDDTRMFEKFGLSLSQTNKYDVNIIGFSSKNIFSRAEVDVHPLFKFKRLSAGRVRAPWKFFRKLLQLKPEIVIVNTAELLLVSTAYRIIFGGKLLYDVQENYFRNILYTGNFPAVVRPLLAFPVRGVEWLTRPWVDHYILAEKLYEQEFFFSKGKSTVVENKYKRITLRNTTSIPAKTGKIRFLYTGTIAENYGIFHAIRFTNNISLIEEKIELIIIGYCAHEKTLARLKREIMPCSHISLIGGDTPVPHQDIVQAICEADFGLLPYQPDKSIENCFPTKIYEYMAHRLPLLIQDHAPWSRFCNRHKAGIAFDYNQYDPGELFNRITHQKFYPYGIPDEIFWEHEELTFIKAVENS